MFYWMTALLASQTRPQSQAVHHKHNTGLRRTSSLHPNIQPQSNCAFQMCRTVTPTVPTANQLRDRLPWGVCKRTAAVTWLPRGLERGCCMAPQR